MRGSARCDQPFPSYSWEQHEYKKQKNPKPNFEAGPKPEDGQGLPQKNRPKRRRICGAEVKRRRKAREAMGKAPTGAAHITPAPPKTKVKVPTSEADNGSTPKRGQGPTAPYVKRLHPSTSMDGTLRKHKKSRSGGNAATHSQSFAEAALRHLKVAIIDKVNPYGKVTADRENLIKCSLIEKLDRTTLSTSSSQSDDDGALAWLEKATADLKPWEEASLVVVSQDKLPKLTKASLWIPGDANHTSNDPERGLQRLTAQNPDMAIARWCNFHHEVKKDPKGHLFVFGIGDDEMAVLRKRAMRLSYTFTSLTLKASANKVKDTSSEPGTSDTQQPTSVVEPEIPLFPQQGEDHQMMVENSEEEAPKRDVGKNKVTIIQRNLQHKKVATATLCLRLDVTEDAIALIQEPWIIKSKITGLSSLNVQILSIPNQQPRTAIYAPRKIKASSMAHFCISDVTAVKVKCPWGEGKNRELILASVYLPSDVATLPPTKEMEDLVDHCLSQKVELIIGCDSNSHHLGWAAEITTLESLQNSADKELLRKRSVRKSKKTPRRLPGYKKRSQRTHIGILTKEDGNKTSNLCESAEVLMKTHFPGSSVSTAPNWMEEEIIPSINDWHLSRTIINEEKTNANLRSYCFGTKSATSNSDKQTKPYSTDDLHKYNRCHENNTNCCNGIIDITPLDIYVQEVTLVTMM
ncbi:unnamed protein product [Diabrotica balteata]|uniref:DUF4780 domain-containing protein n=1 Tax=Diabrotica balteata TaxID=107213 RepID=A0A9N9SXG2_DIABA|nr:unnamed protein product [Diabrotica balteata]